jgi:hypothetical protein
MTHASQRDCTSKTGSTTTDDDKTDLEGCLLCGFMGTRLEGVVSRRESRGERYVRGEE